LEKQKELSIFVLPRANIRGVIDLIPIVKSHVSGFPDILYIIIPKKLLIDSDNAFLFLKIFQKIEKHFKIFLETCYEIHIRPDEDLDKLNKLYLERWRNNELIPPERRRFVEKKIYESLKNNGTDYNKDNINFYIKYFKMSVDNLNWSRKKRLWRDLRKKNRDYNPTEGQKKKLYDKYITTWKKYRDKIYLPDKISPEIDQALRAGYISGSKSSNTSRIEFKKVHFCPMCGADAEGNFCGNCGYDLREKRSFCKNCGAEIDRSGVIFCPSCGERL
jgi:hypothetical protein